MTTSTPLKDSSIGFLCKLFGVSRSGYYAALKTPSYWEKKGITEAEVATLFCCIDKICEPHILPKAGWRQLYHLCKELPALKKMGQNRFKDFLRINDLMQDPPRSTRPRTTFTGKGWKKHQDLLNLEDGRFAPTYRGELLVCDITYVPCSPDATEGGGGGEGGGGKWCYLSLVTDVYSRAIIGHKLSATLETEGPLTALKEALTYLRANGICNTRNIIVHSDRGCQYTSKEYTAFAEAEGIRLSMTQCGNPLDNALAERMNGTVKNSTIYDYGAMTIPEVDLHISDFIRIYNTCRPHQSLSYKTPYNILHDNDDNPLKEILKEIGYKRSEIALQKIRLIYPYIKIRSNSTRKLLKQRRKESKRKEPLSPQAPPATQGPSAEPVHPTLATNTKSDHPNQMKNVPLSTDR